MSIDSVRSMHDVLLEPQVERLVAAARAQSPDSDFAESRSAFGVLDYAIQSCATGIPLSIADWLTGYCVGQGVGFLTAAFSGSTLNPLTFALSAVVMFACL